MDVVCTIREKLHEFLAYTRHRVLLCDSKIRFRCYVFYPHASCVRPKLANCSSACLPMCCVSVGFVWYGRKHYTRILAVDGIDARTERCHKNVVARVTAANGIGVTCTRSSSSIIIMQMARACKNLPGNRKRERRRIY